MFTVGVKGGGSPWVVCNLDQLIEIFPSATLSVTFDELRETFKPKLPPGADLKDYCGAILLSLMDPVTKKVSNPVIMPMHHNIFNNPNISITPSSPLPKQPPIAAASRPPWTVPVSPPVSIVPVPCEPDKLVTNSKETQKNPKRTAPYQISNRTIKQPRLSITKPTNARKDYKSSSNSITLKTHQLKKNDKAVANIDLAITTPSTSNAVIQSTEEVACVQSIKEDLQATNSELNCKDNSPRLDNDKKENGFHRRYCFSDNHFKMYDIGNKKDDSTNLDRDSIEIRTHGEIFEIKKSFVTNELIIAMGTALKKNITDEDFDSLHKTSSTLQSSKFNWSSVTSNISMKSPTRQNNINSINQPNQVGINKSQKQTIISQQPSKQTIKSSSISKQQSTSTNTSSKIQHSTINKTDLKNHVSNNQHNNTSLKHTKATATHIQTSNKQITNSNQLPISSKLVSTTRKLVNLYNVKPAITHQSSVKDIKKCLKCKALSEDETCAACRMSSHLKNVTVTRIETPSTSAVVALESPIVMHSKPIDVPLSSINPVSPQEPCVLLLSSGDEDEEESLEPNITKIETKEALKKHTDKLCLNPKLLEDRLWQKDLSVKDYYKIEECYTVHIGSFKTAPTPSGDMLVCLHGIRMTVQGLEPEPVTIDLPMDNVVKILGYYGENPLLIIYTNHLAAVGIQYLLNMNEDDKSHLYDPLSKDITVNKIVWFFNLKRPEIQNLEKLLLKLSKRKYAALTFNQANKILCLKKKDDEESKILAKEEQDEAERKFNSITILEDKLGERSAIIKICDYRMLNSNEFVNDILIEFYLDYWYSQKLSDEDRNRTYVFSTYFYTTLAKSFNTSDYPSHFTASQIRHEKVKKWTKNVDIFKKDFIFIPINENYHWFMAVICFPYLSGKVNIKDGKPVNAPDDNYGRYKLQQIESTAADRIEADPNVEDLWLFDLASTQNYTDKRGVDYDTDVAVLKKNRNILVKRPCILLFDSFSGGVCRARITATLRDWLEQEYIAKYNDKKKDFSPETIKGSLVKMPQQPNYTDCGLFTIHCFKRFFDRPIVDYTLPIRHLENWFSTDEVAKNCQKRRELQTIIKERMKERGSVLPEGVELPILNFTDPPIKIPQNPHQKNIHTHDIPNSTNRIHSSNPKPSTSHHQSNPAYKLHNRVTRVNREYNHGYVEETDEEGSYYDSTDEEVDRQFNENDHYDEDEDNFRTYQKTLEGNEGEYTEIQRSAQQEDDIEDPIPPYEDESFDGYPVNSNNGNIVVDVNDIHSGLVNHRSIYNVESIPDNNYHSYRSNNPDLSYVEYEDALEYEEGNYDRELDDVDDEDIGVEEEYIKPNSTTNHNRHDNHFNSSRLSN